MEARARPSDAGNGSRVVPVFPLSNVYLFPGCVMPLHVFEPRYRRMVEDLLDRSGRLVVGTIQDGEVDGCGRPALLEIGGLGEIGRHERLPDGRFLIWLFGIARVRLREVASTNPYRQVEIEALCEVDLPKSEVDHYEQRVRTALLSRSPEFLNLPDSVPLTHLVDLLMQRMQLPGSIMRELYCECDLRRRADRALSEHERRPATPPNA